MAAETFYSALHWAKKAEASAKLAADLAQTEGKVIQLGFDGAIEDGQLVFKHAPGGVEVPYQLVDDVEYELDLAYNGDLDSLTTMVVKNGNDTVSFVSALHRSSTEPARVADMDAVMRYDATTGYRWLFKATFKIAPNGAKVFLLYPVVAAKDYNDKTNCITEIPQDIKLELNNGTLTLKAGSKVYVPNGKNADGSNKFDEVVIASDIVCSNYATAGNRLIMHNNNAVIGGVRDYAYSGDTSSMNSTTPYAYAYFYNTQTNKMYNGNGSSWVEGSFSLPLGMATNNSSSQYTSIDQVFNGFGYIGSTIFALPNVKGLAPNGRNADGSLKNTEVVCEGVSVYSTSAANTFLVYIKPNVAARFAGRDTHFEQNEKPTVSTTYATWYSPEENRFRYTDDRGATWTDTIGYVHCVTITTTTGGVITSFNPKTAFHAIDYNDSSWVSAQAMPSGKYIDLTVGASGATYAAPANGWFYFGINANTAGAGITISWNNMVITQIAHASGNQLRRIFPVKQGDSVHIIYKDSAASILRFIYAQGEN